MFSVSVCLSVLRGASLYRDPLPVQVSQWNAFLLMFSVGIALQERVPNASALCDENVTTNCSDACPKSEQDKQHFMYFGFDLIQYQYDVFTGRSSPARSPTIWAPSMSYRHRREGRHHYDSNSSDGDTEYSEPEERPKSCIKRSRYEAKSYSDRVHLGWAKKECESVNFLRSNRKVMSRLRSLS